VSSVESEARLGSGEAAGRRTGPGLRLAFAGAVAVGAGLAAGELLAGVLGVPAPLLAIARFIVDIQPPGAKDVVVALFGEADKIAFQVFIIVVALGIGGVLGRVAPRRPDLATIVIAGFAGAGFAAALRDPNNIPALSAAVAAAGAIAGITVLRRLVRVALAGTTEQVSPTTAASTPDWGRRSLLQAGGAIAVGSVVAGSVGRLLLERQRSPETPADIPSIPRPVALPAGADIATTDLLAGGLSPIVVPNGDFYRIDTAFIPPTVERDTWRLKVAGLVDREIELTYDELVALPLVEQYVTIACVSNNVGGNLVGNAKWTGVPLRAVLGLAGVQSHADQLVGRSIDGFTAGMPVEWVMDESRVPMIAVGMNGEPLPRIHGYPARLIIPGLFGYVSATKWLTELQLTRFDQFQGYWVPLGWAARAPILTQSRVDVPRAGARLSAGTVPIAGVAWAPDRGIQRVEVKVDDAEWVGARLSAPISGATWVQWLYLWDATAGDHQITVRAVDGAGEVQTDMRSNPAPDGARGHHSVRVSVA
jgi:DMSO/TMAO reductase YedYZ molybdopterin-dependent catalytic subunit